MDIFWFEFLFFATAMFGILVSFSSATLFYLTLRAERRTQTAWRAIGFLLLVIAFLLFILERKYSSVGAIAVVVELFGFFAIYRGVLAEPKLTHLLEGARPSVRHKEQETGPRRGWMDRIFIIDLIFDAVLLVLVIAGLLIWAFAPEMFTVVIQGLRGSGASIGGLSPFILSVLILVSLVFILLTIRLQIRRYRSQRDDSEARRVNRYPLIGYIFLAISVAAYAAYRLPAIDLVWTRLLNAEYGIAWIAGTVATAMGFLFLTLWAWRFIRVRFFLRTYVVFMTLAVGVATAGVLIFSLLIFRIVERNNLELMARGADTETLIMVERRNVAETLARLIAGDFAVRAALVSSDPDLFSSRAEFIREHTNVDMIRLLSPQGDILASPTDPRDVGRALTDDELLRRVAAEGKPRSSFDIMPGVLAPVVVGRALYPIASASDTLGVVEVAYIFDNAFVDFSKQETGLEVTMYSGAERSASTIRTEDGTSRWVGSLETESAVLERVLGNGEEYETALDRLGTPYYSAFSPVRNSDGEIIGMVSVGVPTHILLEESRQRLLSSFFMATLISFLAAIAGYYAFRNFKKRAPVAA